MFNQKIVIDVEHLTVKGDTSLLDITSHHSHTKFKYLKARVMLCVARMCSRGLVQADFFSLRTLIYCFFFLRRPLVLGRCESEKKLSPNKKKTEIFKK